MATCRCGIFSQTNTNKITNFCQWVKILAYIVKFIFCSFFEQLKENARYSEIVGDIWFSPVHFVKKRAFVQNLWRLANLYIFGILRESGIQKSMQAFALTPLSPPSWIFKMAATKYIICDILASIQNRNLLNILTLCFLGQGIQKSSKSFISQTYLHFEVSSMQKYPRTLTS